MNTLIRYLILTCCGFGVGFFLQKVFDSPTKKYLRKIKKENKSLKKGLKDLEERKVTIVRTIEEVFKKDEREKYLYYRVYLYFYRLFWQLIRLPGDIRRYVRDFFQRGRRGWANSDTWSFECCLSKIITAGVKHLKRLIMNYQLGKKEKQNWNV